MANESQPGPGSVTSESKLGVVKIAAIIWLVFGALILLNALLQLSQGIKDTGQQVLVVILGLFALAFIFVGYQTLKGTAKDTLGNGIGSILLAGVGSWNSYGSIMIGQFDLYAIISLLSVVALIVAGILALVGRADYKAWRESLGKK
jgi:hypothetical protein